MHKGLNPQINRIHNRSLLLRLLREESMSRSELARRAGLSKPVVTEIVVDLLARGLIIEGAKGESHQGRKPILLEINRESMWVVGVDLAREHVNVIITDLLGNVVRRRREDVAFDRPEALAAPVADLVKRLVRESGIPEGRIAGIGIGAPLPLNRPGKVLVDRKGIPGWTTAMVSDEIQREFGAPVFIDNDANVAALFEKWHGIGVDWDNFLYLMVGEGIGCGIIVDGQIFSGVEGMAGEAGHMSVEVDGARCWCGNIGCLEALASVPAMLREARARGIEINSEAPRECQLQQLADAISEGNVSAYDVQKKAATYLACGLVNLVNLFNPDAVIVGGELSLAGVSMMTLIKDEVQRRSHPLFSPSLKLVSSSYDENQVAKGAALLVLQHFYAYPQKYANVQAGGWHEGGGGRKGT